MIKERFNNDKEKIKILLIGPLPPPVGGITVLFNGLVDELSTYDDIELRVINSSGIRNRGWLGLYRFIKFIRNIFLQAGRTDIVGLHAATSGLPITGPIALISAKLFRKVFMVRKFGGADYRDYGFLRRSIIRWVLSHAHLYFAETKMLIEAAKEDGINNIRWYPNSRPRHTGNERKSINTWCRKFVYLGHIRPAKGIFEIIEAAKRLEIDVTIDLYGPLMEGITKDDFKGIPRLNYHGEVHPNQVIETLMQYDVLLLPSHHSGEGYPGVILEAYLAGLPVICTQWRALPEIVDEKCGILIEPYDAKSLLDAMVKISGDRKLFQKLKSGVKRQQGKFSSEKWSRKYVECCKKLMENKCRSEAG